MSDDRPVAGDAVGMDSTLHTVHLYEITVDPTQQETSEESDRSLQTDPGSVEVFETGANFPLTLFQTVNDLSNSGEVVVMSECPAGEGQEELLSGITAAILTQGHGLVTDEAVCVEDVTRTTDELSDVHGGHEVIAYFETIPNVFPSEASPQFTFSPDTVLSSALSSKPISSTLPIVSKHLTPSPSSLVLTVERLDTDDGEGDDGRSDEDSGELQDHQLEEHW